MPAAATLVLVAGDGNPPLDVTIRRRGVAVDLTGHTINARLKIGAAAAAAVTVAIVTAAAGLVRVTWGGALVLPVGSKGEECLLEFVIDQASASSRETTPIPLRFHLRPALA